MFSSWISTGSLFLIMCLGSSVYAAGAAEVCQSVHAKLASGRRAEKTDADAVNAELSLDQSNPFKRIVAGEVLASLGLYALANEQFETADRLQKDYVLGNFKKVVDSNHFIPAVLFLYLQDKYPKDSAVLCYAARRNLGSMAFSKEQKQKALSTARKELEMAAISPEPWPGTFSTLAMLDYNEGAMLAPGAEKERKLAEALKNVNLELKRHPDDALAQKIAILTLCRQGKKPWELFEQLQKALKVASRDAGLNLLLGRAYIYKGDYKSAIRPALIGLFDEQDPSSLSEAREEVYQLIARADRSQLLAAIDEISSGLAESNSAGHGFRSTLMRMRLADLFSMAGDRQEACRQLKIALTMHPHFRAAVAFKLGYELTLMHDYFGAYPYIDLACRLVENPSDAEKYMGFRTRIARVGLNSERDLALKLKTMLCSTKVAHQ